MPEWVIERGIGESRAALIDHGRIVEARILLDGVARAGSRLDGRVKAVSPRTIVEAGGHEYLLPSGAPSATEGAKIIIEITREAIPGAEPWKRPLAKDVGDTVHDASPVDARALPFPGPDDALGRAGWWDVIEEARTGLVSFAGGELRITATPAMTLIDVDGYLPADELAVTGAAAAARAIRRLDIGGSIGVDLPTPRSKAARLGAAAAIDAELPQRFERTSVNGFGFIQIVRPRPRGSLVELAQDRAAFEARALLRRGALEPPGPKHIVAHAAVIAVLERHPDWIEAFTRQIGGAVSLRVEPSLTISGGYAEAA